MRTSQSKSISAAFGHYLSFDNSFQLTSLLHPEAMTSPPQHGSLAEAIRF